IRAGPSQSTLPSQTTLPFASTMQTEIVLSDTSNPTYSAIALPPLTGASDPSSTVVVRGWDRITPAHAEQAARASAYVRPWSALRARRRSPVRAPWPQPAGWSDGGNRHAL